MKISLLNLYSVQWWLMIKIFVIFALSQDLKLDFFFLLQHGNGAHLSISLFFLLFCLTDTNRHSLCIQRLCPSQCSTGPDIGQARLAEHHRGVELVAGAQGRRGATDSHGTTEKKYDNPFFFHTIFSPFRGIEDHHSLLIV